MEKIEAYIQQKLKENEKIAFEQELSKNAELRNKVVSLKLITEILQHYATQHKINTLHKTITSSWLVSNNPISESPEIEIIEEKNLYDKETDVSASSKNWLSKLLITFGVMLLLTFGIFLVLIYTPITLPKFDERYTLLHDSELAYYNDNFEKSLQAIEEAEATYTFSENEKTKVNWMKTIVLAEIRPKVAQNQLQIAKNDIRNTISTFDEAQIWSKILWLKLMGKNNL